MAWAQLDNTRQNAHSVFYFRIDPIQSFDSLASLLVYMGPFSVGRFGSFLILHCTDLADSSKHTASSLGANQDLAA